MNKNKLIFLIIGIGIIIGLFVFVKILSSSTKQASTGVASNLNIWILQDDQTKFNTFLNNFTQTNPQYKNAKFNVTSFSDYNDYFYSLIGSFLIGKSPDLFVLNNSDGNFFDSQIVGIDPNDIKVDDFRKNYDLVFSNDLISSTEVDGKKIEYLKGIPLGYETLGVFYNFMYLKGKKLDTWSYINDAITELKATGIQTSLGIGNGTTVFNSADIIAQFFLMDNIKSLKESTPEALKNSVSNYYKFGDINGDNGYNYFFDDLTSTQKNNLDLFSKGDLQMVIGYPRMIQEIEKRGYNKSFLRASSFPSYTDKVGKTMVNYNYFVINKNTQNMGLSVDLLKYFSTKDAQGKYLETFDYYLPTNINLNEQRLEQNVMTGYYIKYKDFYNPNLELTTFNKGYKTLFDSEVPSILDKGLNGAELFENFKKRLLCLSNKMISQDKLGTTCE